MRKHLAALAITGLCAATGAFAHDAYRLRVLDAEKEVERRHTVQVSLGEGVKVMPVTVLEAKGDLRRVGMTIADFRARQAAPATRLLVDDAVYGQDEARKRMETAPVVRVAGVVDCGTTKAKWTALEYAKDMTKNASFASPSSDPQGMRFLPKVVPQSALHEICSLTPAQG